MLGFAQTHQGPCPWTPPEALPLDSAGALPLDPTTFEKVDETFILRFTPRY